MWSGCAAAWLCQRSWHCHLSPIQRLDWPEIVLYNRGICLVLVKSCGQLLSLQWRQGINLFLKSQYQCVGGNRWFLAISANKYHYCQATVPTMLPRARDFISFQNKFIRHLLPRARLYTYDQYGKVPFMIMMSIPLYTNVEDISQHHMWSGTTYTVTFQEYTLD